MNVFSVIIPFKQTQTVPLTALNFSTTLLLRRFFNTFLGETLLTATNGPYRVCISTQGCATEGTTPFLGTKEEARSHLLPIQEHNYITVMSPVGSGKENSFQLSVANQKSNNITLYYKAPIITR